MNELKQLLEEKLAEFAAKVKEYIEDKISNIIRDVDRLDELFSIQIEQDKAIEQLKQKTSELTKTIQDVQNILESLSEQIKKLNLRLNLHLADHAKKGENR